MWVRAVEVLGDEMCEKEKIEGIGNGKECHGM